MPKWVVSAQMGPSGRADRSLAESLRPHLIEACNGRLDGITWFRADWQRGGAATGRGNWKQDDGTARKVIVKVPVGPRELFWTRRLQAGDGSPPDTVAQLLASGLTLGPYDLAWMVIEALPVGPLGLHWEDTHVGRIAEAATRLHAQTRSFEIDPDQVAREDWSLTLDKAMQALKDNALEQTNEWKKLHRRLGKALDSLVARWRKRPLDQWIHGDLHLANALCRSDEADAPVILIDLAEVRPGHWVEDAVYLERQLWSRSQRLALAPVKTMRRARRAAGLGLSDEDHTLADIRRLLMAATAPAFLRTEGHPKHLQACLEQATAAAGRLDVA
ncbi:MAG: aminoglycoside phosphotransferase family protein [Phycisphaerales bacterium]|nr:aminoglycoside phosphotransferase family protein [Phycisphaerales bacterium]